MKKSTQNICICSIVAVIVGLVAVGMAYCGLLPELSVPVHLALKFVAAVLLLLFILAALSGCQCMRKLFVALCRYGKCLVVALVGSLFFGFLLIAVGMLCKPVALELLVLFLFIMLLVLAMLALALVIYTMVGLGCPPPCKKPTPRPCAENDDFDSCKF